MSAAPNSSVANTFYTSKGVIFMTAKPVYNPIESVSTLACVIHEIKQAYGEDVKKLQPGIVSPRSLEILKPFMDICMEKSKEVRNRIKKSKEVRNDKRSDSCHDMKSRTILNNVDTMEYYFEDLQNFLRRDTTCNYGCSKDDYLGSCYSLLDQLRSSIECVVFYPDVYISRLVRDAA